MAPVFASVGVRKVAKGLERAELAKLKALSKRGRQTNETARKKAVINKEPVESSAEHLTYNESAALPQLRPGFSFPRIALLLS